MGQSVENHWAETPQQVNKIMEFPFQQVLKMGYILISGLFIIQNIKTSALFPMHCFLNLDSCIERSQSAFCLCMGWNVTNELLIAESNVTADTPSYWTSPEHKPWEPLIPPILPHHPLSWASEAPFLGSPHLKYCSVCLLCHKFFREVHDSPWRAQQLVSEVQTPLKSYPHKCGCTSEEAIIFFIFSNEFKILEGYKQLP